MQVFSQGQSAFPVLPFLNKSDHRPALRLRRAVQGMHRLGRFAVGGPIPTAEAPRLVVGRVRAGGQLPVALLARDPGLAVVLLSRRDRKSTRLNSSHTVISYAVFCLKKKK